MSVSNKSSQDCHTAKALFRLGAFLWFFAFVSLPALGKRNRENVKPDREPSSDEQGRDNSHNHFLSPSQHEKGASKTCWELGPSDGHNKLHGGEGQLAGDGAVLGCSWVSFPKADIRALRWGLRGIR